MSRRRHRHRENNVTKMHQIIGHYEQVLDQIAKIPFVQSVITGPIAPNKSEQDELTYQYDTDSGLKLLAKTKEAVQEIYVVTEERAWVRQELSKRGQIREKVKSMKKQQKPGKKPAGGIAGNTPRYDARYDRNDTPKEAKPSTLKDLLNPDILAKLQAQADELKETERAAQEAKRQAEVDRRAREKKALENDFEHLLNSSKQNWKDFK